MANFPGTNRAGLWLLGFFLLFLSLLSAANFYLLLNNRDGASDAEEAPMPADVPPPIFVKVGPMTVNLQDDVYGNRLLYTGLSLKVEDEDTRDNLLTHMPEVHSRLLLLLSAQSAGKLTAPGGKEALAAKIKALFEQPLAEGLQPPFISAVLFTDFIVQ